MFRLPEPGLFPAKMAEIPQVKSGASLFVNHCATKKGDNLQDMILNIKKIRLLLQSTSQKKRNYITQ